MHDWDELSNFSNIYALVINLGKPQKGLQLDHGGLRAVPEAASGEQLWVRAG